MDPAAAMTSICRRAVPFLIVAALALVLPARSTVVEATDHWSPITQEELAALLGSGRPVRGRLIQGSDLIALLDRLQGRRMQIEDSRIVGGLDFQALPATPAGRIEFPGSGSRAEERWRAVSRTTRTDEWHVVRSVLALRNTIIGDPPRHPRRHDFLPVIDASNTLFLGIVSFHDVTIDGRAVFDGAFFSQEVLMLQLTNRWGPGSSSGLSFASTWFLGPAHFLRSTLQLTSFRDAVFANEANFGQVQFSSGAVFEGARFEAIADFTQAAFPSFIEFTNAEFNVANFQGVKFERGAGFGAAEFGTANFNGTTFHPDTSFEKSRFDRSGAFQDSVWHGVVDFSEAIFGGKAEFERTRFSDAVDFGGATFCQGAGFSGLTFPEAARFGDAIFGHRGIPDFGDTRFEAVATFARTVFVSNVTFDAANFADLADFFAVRFERGPGFAGAVFASDANFSQARFGPQTSFLRARFDELADFRDSAFDGVLDLRFATLRGYINFFGAEIGTLNFDNTGRPNLVEGQIDFRNSVLGRVDVQDVAFAQHVEFSDAQIGNAANRPRQESLDLSDVCGPPPAPKTLVEDAGGDSATPVAAAGVEDVHGLRPAGTTDPTDGMGIFRFATFEDGVSFLRSRFAGRIAFERVSFEGEANFTEADFSAITSDGPGFSLSYVDIEPLRIGWSQLPPVSSWVRTGAERFGASHEAAAHLPAGSVEDGASDVEQPQSVAQVLRALETNFRDRGMLVDANQAYFHRQHEKLEEARQHQSLWQRLPLELEWLSWGVVSGYGTRLFRLVGWVLVIDLLFALVYTTWGTIRRVTPPSAQSDFDFRLRLLEFPRAFLGARDSEPTRRFELSGSLRRFADALRLSSVLLLKVGYRDTTVRGRVLGIDLAHVVAIEWVLGYLLLGALIVTLSNTQPLVHRLLTGAF